MTTSPLDNPYPYAPKIAGIVQAFVQDGAEKSQEMKQVQPVSLKDYKVLCQYFINGKSMLTDSMLEERIRYIYDDAKLKQHFRPGYKICPVVLPFDNIGLPLTPEELASGSHLRLLIINESGRTVAGFGNEVCSTFSMLPPEVQNVAFTVGSYERPEEHVISPNDRTRIAQQYTTAYRSLEALLR